MPTRLPGFCYFAGCLVFTAKQLAFSDNRFSMSPSARNTVAWVLQVLLGVAFIGFGAYGLPHAAKIPGGLANGIPAIAFLVLLLVLFWLRRPTAVALA